MARIASWIRREAKGNIQAEYQSAGSPKKVTIFSETGLVLVKDSEPLYDNGLYYVVDTVKDLEFVVVSWDGHRGHRAISLDLKEAIELADSYAAISKEN